MKNRIQTGIALCGIKHSGKSSVASALAEILHWEFFDTDDFLAKLFADRTGRTLSVREIYRELGETKFRLLEAEAVRRLPSGRNGGRIVALGGGVLTNPNFTAEDRASLGFLCWLDTPDEVAYERILRNGLPPFLARETDPQAAFKKMNEDRRIVFRENADAAVRPEPESTPEETARKILRIYRERTAK